MVQRAVGVAGPHGGEIGRQQRAGLGRQRGIEQAADAVAPFAGAAGFLRGEIVEAGAGMDVDHPERGRFAAQMHQHAGENRVLEYVGEAAGMKGVAVVHGAPRTPRSRNVEDPSEEAMGESQGISEPEGIEGWPTIGRRAAGRPAPVSRRAPAASPAGRAGRSDGRSRHNHGTGGPATGRS
jgi:hypothetical protein